MARKDGPFSAYWNTSVRNCFLMVDGRDSKVLFYLRRFDDFDLCMFSFNTYWNMRRWLPYYEWNELMANGTLKDV